MAISFFRKRLFAQSFDEENHDVQNHTKFVWFVTDIVNSACGCDVFQTETEPQTKIHNPAKENEFADIDDFAELSDAIANFQMEPEPEFIENIHKEKFILNDFMKYIILQ